MKRLLFCITLCVLGVFATVAQNLPNAKVQNQKGQAVETASFVDGETPFIISFWATTCKPCIKELDAINEAMEEWLETKKFRVIAVSIDDSRSINRAKALATGRGWEDFTLVYDENQDFKRAMNVVLTPQVFVYDKEGNQVYAHTGYAPGNENELFKIIKDLK